MRGVRCSEIYQSTHSIYYTGTVNMTISRLNYTDFASDLLSRGDKANHKITDQEVWEVKMNGDQLIDKLKHCATLAAPHEWNVF